MGPVSRRSFLGTCAAAPLLRAAPNRRYNVLFLIADDLNTELEPYGSTNVHTPNLSMLARKGVVFQQNHCQFPLCQPSRASLLSGRRPDTTGVYTLQTPTRAHMPDTIFLPEFFRKNGYFTAHAGKVYHTGDHAEDPRSWDEELREYGKTPDPKTIIRKVKGDGPKGHTFEYDVLNVSDPQMPDGMMAAKAVSYIEQAVRAGRPFFVGAGFRRPHAPYAAPKPHFDRHPWQSTSLPAGVPTPPLIKPAFNYAPPDRPMPEQQVREFRAAYFSCVDFVDAQVGVVLSALDRLNQWQTTVVVMTADHGYHLGDHGGLWHKLSLFENSTRVPLIVYAPGAAANGHACARLTESVDIYPSLVELCGFDAPSGLEGTSFAPLLGDPSKPWKRAAFSMVGRGDELAEAPEKIAFFGRTIRTERWRYTSWDGGKMGEELYDHASDPAELHNLATAAAHAATIRTLRSQLVEGWRAARL